MKRLPVFLLAGVIVTLVTAASAAAASGGTTVSSVSSTTWPSRSYVLTLPPGAELDPSAVHVTENGQPVSDVSVQGGQADSKKFGVVLVIDASDSMHGQPIADAMAAARAFVAQRAPNQPIAVVAFSRTPQVLLPFTTNPQEIAAALKAAPSLNSGTHIFDAADKAIALLASAQIKSGSIVLLSDGADTGSTSSLSSVSSDAVANGVRIFTVGLEGNGFDPTTLTDLAAGAGGSYTDAPTSKQLAAIFNQLGVQLANQYVIHYLSLAPSDKKVDVQVAVERYGPATTFAYQSPPLTATATSYNPTLLQRFWSSPLSLLVVAVLCAMLIAYAVVMIVQPSRRAMRKRVTHFVDPDAIATEDDGTPAITAIAETLYDRTEQTLAGKPRWEHFKEEVEISRVPVTAAQLMVVSTVGAFALSLLVATITGITLLLALTAVGPLIAVMWVNGRAEAARSAFSEQLPVNLEVLASALRSGHSLVGALRVVVEDAAEPSRSEFQRVVNDEQAGVQLETAFAETVRRMQNTDLQQIAIVSQIQREAGGNTAEVLDQVTENIRARAELRRLVNTLTAQGRLSRWVVTALPIVLLALISLFNPGYLHPLFHSTAGLVMFFFSAVMVVAGSLLIKKIVKIDL